MSSYMFVFFKQKTAYEMRISDWSSDVCSSDLIEERKSSPIQPRARTAAAGWAIPPRLRSYPHIRLSRASEAWRQMWSRHCCCWLLSSHSGRSPADRSEEHTSELQSLMRISYAVFCLKNTTQ